MNILVTCDDGAFSQGINTLIKELAKVGNLTVVAPDRERSATGHSITFFNPLRVFKIREEENLVFYTCDGTPADCVILGVYDLMGSRPDLVVSGINRGANMGDDITYSGTVSAALEGLLQKIPSIALSVAAFEDVHYEYASKIGARLAQAVHNYGLPERTILNVNFPNLPEEEIKGIEITRQGKTIYEQKLIKRMDPRGIEYYWLAGEIPFGEPEEGTDFRAVYEQKVSITPVTLNFTNFAAVPLLRSWKF